MSPQGAGNVVSTSMREVMVCDRWPLLVPEHRALRPEWPWWEWPRMASMRANLSRGMVLWDVGTEEGDQSALWAQWVADTPVKGWQDITSDGIVDHPAPPPLGGIVLIEPNPLAWPNIRAIWEANDVPMPLAWFVGLVGDSAWVQFETARDHFSGTAGSEWPRWADGPLVGDHGFLHLTEMSGAPEVRLDDLTTFPRCDAITIDIEGSELLALRGAHRILLDQRPLVWVSIHRTELAEYHGHTRDQVIAYMGSLNYRHEHLADEHEEHAFFYPAERAHDVVLPYGGDPR